MNHLDTPATSARRWPRVFTIEDPLVHPGGFLLFVLTP